tara:strand:- start:483 stop:782 length:300 start_codon:yes stop_codon:yes gene_type:complete
MDIEANRENIRFILHTKFKEWNMDTDRIKIEDALRERGIIPLTDKLKVLRNVNEHPDTPDKERWKIMDFLVKYILSSKQWEIEDFRKDLDEIVEKYIYE